MTNTWFTADTHYGHKNIIRFSNRPFSSVEEMNEEMITRFNERVKPGDTVYHLGDFAFLPSHEAKNIKDRLNGDIHLILGNHDKPKNVRGLGFASVNHLQQIKLEGKTLILCHYAMRVWNKAHYKSLMLYGHSHGNLPGTDQSLDVGVDCWDYKPVSLEEILERLATLPKYFSEDNQPR